MDEDEIILSSNPNSLEDVMDYSLKRLLCIENVESLILKSDMSHGLQFCEMTDTLTSIGDTIKERINDIIDRECFSQSSFQSSKIENEDETDDDDQSQYSYSLLTAQEHGYVKNNKVLRPGYENTTNRNEHENMSKTPSPPFSMPFLSLPLSITRYCDDQTMPSTPKLLLMEEPLTMNQTCPVSPEVFVNHYMPENILLDSPSESRSESKEFSKERNHKSKHNVKIDLNNSMRDLLTYSIEEASLYDHILEPGRLNLNAKQSIIRHDGDDDDVSISENINNQLPYSDRSTQENLTNEISKEANVNSASPKKNYENYNTRIELSPSIFSTCVNNSYQAIEAINECVTQLAMDQDNMAVTCSHNGSTQNIVEVSSVESTHAKDQIVLIETDSEDDESEIKRQKLAKIQKKPPPTVNGDLKKLQNTNQKNIERPNLNVNNNINNNPYDRNGIQLITMGNHGLLQQKVHPQSTLDKYLEAAKEGCDPSW